jgi:MFS family permease
MMPPRSNSALMLGLVGFTSQILSFLLTPCGGVFVDRSDPRRILIGTQILAILQSLTLAALLLSGGVQICYLLALSLFQGIVNV